jgi:membrane protein
LPESEPTTAETRTARAAPEPLIIEASYVRQTLWLFRRAFLAAYEDNCFGIAKGAAYSFLLSLFPILTTMTAILIQVNAQSVVHVLATFVSNVVPPGTEDLVLSRLRAGTKPISLSIVAIALSLWAGSGAMMSLMEGFQAAYRIPSGRPFLKERGMAIFLVLIAALPAVGASSLILFGFRIEQAVIHSAGVYDISFSVQILWRIARYALAFCTTTFVTGLLYYFGPNHRPEPSKTRKPRRSRFLRVWPGAFLATILWLISTAGFAWYVRRLANYNFFFGSLATVIILLIWLYLIACIALIGCEYNAERERIETLRVR